jgi:hypothetical protein
VVAYGATGRCPRLASGAPLLQACSCGTCERCRQRSGVAPPIVDEVVRSSGRPLDECTRAHFEPRFGYDFGACVSIRVRGQPESAHAVNALAYTVNNDIVFGDSQ